VKPNGAARWFAEEWTAQLATVLESLAGERPKLACTTAGQDRSPAQGSEEIVRQHGAVWWWQQRFPLPGDPVLWVGAPQNAWSQLAARVLGAAGVEEESQARETYIEILQQSMAELARSAGRRWSRQIEAPGSPADAAPDSGELYHVEGSYPDGALPPLLLAITGDPSEPPPPDPPAALPHLENTPASSRTFELLMGVELPLSVSFGHVQLPLGDVLKLAAGSIIELNRTVDEPVEVIVNNCVIARGEVVVVEGNYGVRIHQIMSRQERLENLP